MGGSYVGFGQPGQRHVFGNAGCCRHDDLLCLHAHSKLDGQCAIKPLTCVNQDLEPRVFCRGRRETKSDRRRLSKRRESAGRTQLWAPLRRSPPRGRVRSFIVTEASIGTISRAEGESAQCVASNPLAGTAESGIAASAERIRLAATGLPTRMFPVYGSQSRAARSGFDSRSDIQKLTLRSEAVGAGQLGFEDRVELAQAEHSAPAPGPILRTQGRHTRRRNRESFP